MRTSPWGRDSGLPGWVFIGARQVRRDGKVITKTEPGGELPGSWLQIWRKGLAPWDVESQQGRCLRRTSFVAPQVLSAATPNRFPYGGILL